ncbi:DinB family protein [Mucilaginibacter limnophilus]|uniref:DinB family protein n=1 Tax=Mucilaginibacter limnophilus TaxID=1932778 RepID=A0A3S2Y0W2_9SPHI|nr:DinB family protein [Mucilaginibacter limnophilus]RVU00858.1 DinB family protein [Mucilaginibacter limnophilus]
MKTDKKTLLQQLAREVQLNIKEVQKLEDCSEGQLIVIPATGGWNIAQVIEHLNTYNAYYLPAIQKAMKQAVADKNCSTFKPGILGDYFVKMMQPKNSSIGKRYKAASRHIPTGDINAREVLKTYLNNQQRLLQLLDIADGYNINTIKIPTSISSLIKLKLGDVFRFLIAHQQRHFVQIEHILNTKIQLKQAPL